MRSAGAATRCVQPLARPARHASRARCTLVEQPALRRGASALLDPREEALEDPRHGERSPSALASRSSASCATPRQYTDPGADATAAGSSRRCARTCATAAGSTGRDRQIAPCRSACRPDVGEDVAMRQHHALRTPRGAGRVAGASSPAHRRRSSRPRVAGLRRQTARHRWQRARPSIGMQYDVGGSGCPAVGADRRGLAAMREPLDDQQPRLGVMPTHHATFSALSSTYSGTTTSPQVQRGEVGRYPVDAVLRHDRDAVAGANPTRCNAACQRPSSAPARRRRRRPSVPGMAA